VKSREIEANNENKKLEAKIKVRNHDIAKIILSVK